MNKKAFKQVNEISKHCKYQLSVQGLHGDMNDLAYKLQEFITSEVMTEKALEKLYLIGIEHNNPTALKHFIQLSGKTANNTTR